MQTIKSRKVDIFGFANVVIPLLVGGIIYACISPDVFFVRWAREQLGIFSFDTYMGEGLLVKNIVRNHLPDMLWSYSLVYALVLILGNKNKHILLAIVMSSVLGICLEYLQLVKVITGTGDILDVFCEVITSVIAGAMIICRRGKNEKRN